MENCWLLRFDVSAPAGAVQANLFHTRAASLQAKSGGCRQTTADEYEEEGLLRESCPSGLQRAAHMNLGDRDDGSVLLREVSLSRYDGVEALNDRGDGRRRVDRLVRHRRVTTLAANLNGEAGECTRTIGHRRELTEERKRDARRRLRGQAEGRETEEN